MDPDAAFATPHEKFHRLLLQSLREALEQLVNAALLPIEPFATTALRLATRRKVDHLVRARPAQDKLLLGAEATDQSTAQNGAIYEPNVAHTAGQARMLRELAYERRDRLAL